MARPKKPGLDYYPKDVGYYSDRKIRRLMAEFGTKGSAIYDYLLCVIYQENGYYVEYDDHFDFDVADALGCGIKEDLVKEVISGCIRVGLFNRNLFENRQILTSKGIQKRYCLAKRNPVIDEEINVLDAKTKVSDVKTPKINAESTQSKVKESKVNNIYIGDYGETEFLERWKKARLHFDKKPTNISKLKTNDAAVFNKLREKYSPEDFKDAIGGLFFQDTYPQTRIQPTHFLENFEQYLDCWRNKEKLYAKKNKNSKKDML